MKAKPGPSFNNWDQPMWFWCVMIDSQQGVHLAWSRFSWVCAMHQSMIAGVRVGSPCKHCRHCWTVFVVSLCVFTLLLCWHKMGNVFVAVVACWAWSGEGVVVSVCLDWQPFLNNLGNCCALGCHQPIQCMSVDGPVCVLGSRSPLTLV